MTIYVNPQLGDAVMQYVADSTGVNCHVVMIIVPIEETDKPDLGKLGTPCFVSSLVPEVMEELIIQIAGNMAMHQPPVRIGGVHIRKQ